MFRDSICLYLPFDVLPSVSIDVIEKINVRPTVLCTFCTYKESCLQLFKELLLLLPLTLKFPLCLKSLLIKYTQFFKVTLQNDDSVVYLFLNYIPLYFNDWGFF